MAMSSHPLGTRWELLAVLEAVALCVIALVPVVKAEAGNGQTDTTTTTTGKFIQLAAWTIDDDKAATDMEFHVSFSVEGTWSQNYVFFQSADRGEVTILREMLLGWPEKMNLQIPPDPPGTPPYTKTWGVSRIQLYDLSTGYDVTLLLDCASTAEGCQWYEDSPWWVSGHGGHSRIFDVPAQKGGELFGEVIHVPTMTFSTTTTESSSTSSITTSSLTTATLTTATATSSTSTSTILYPVAGLIGENVDANYASGQIVGFLLAFCLLIGCIAFYRMYITLQRPQNIFVDIRSVQSAIPAAPMACPEQHAESPNRHAGHTLPKSIQAHVNTRVSLAELRIDGGNPSPVLPSKKQQAELPCPTLPMSSLVHPAESCAADIDKKISPKSYPAKSLAMQAEGDKKASLPPLVPKPFSVLPAQTLAPPSLAPPAEVAKKASVAVHSPSSYGRSDSGSPSKKDKTCYHCGRPLRLQGRGLWWCNACAVGERNASTDDFFLT